MSNAFRFLRFSILCLVQPRHRHTRHNFLPLIAAFGGALVLSMPAWMFILGVI